MIPLTINTASILVIFLILNVTCQNINTYLKSPLTLRRHSYFGPVVSMYMKCNLVFLFFTGHIEGESYLMNTDYESYFVSYSCLGQDENSKCNKPEVSLWSRSTTIPPEKFAEAQLTINGLCLNYGVFETVENLNGRTYMYIFLY